jgi:cathepsin X
MSLPFIILAQLLLLVNCKFRGLTKDPKGPFEYAPMHVHEDESWIARVRDLSAWDWRNVNGIDFTSPNRDQHQPNEYCGGCWAFATTSHLSDRLNIARGNTFPGLEISPQVLLTCGPSYEAGCSDGGDPSSGLKWIHQNGIPGETCHNYEAKDLTCNASAVCQDCNFATGICDARSKFPVHTIQGYGHLEPQGDITKKEVIAAMVLKMKAEIVARGPIVCQMSCPDPVGSEHDGYVDDYQPFYNKWGEEFPPRILHDTNYTCNNSDWDACVDHNIVVSGFGTEAKADGEVVPYWIVRNSWGEWWGEQGWFRIVQGVNNLGIESGCDFAVVNASSAFAAWPRGSELRRVVFGH